MRKHNQIRTLGAPHYKAEVSGYWFFNSWSISEKILVYPCPILIQNFLNLVSNIHPYPIVTLAKYATDRQWL